MSNFLKDAAEIHNILIKEHQKHLQQFKTDVVNFKTQQEKHVTETKKDIQSTTSILHSFLSYVEDLPNRSISYKDWIDDHIIHYVDSQNKRLYIHKYNYYYEALIVELLEFETYLEKFNKTKEVKNA